MVQRVMRMEHEIRRVIEAKEVLSGHVGAHALNELTLVDIPGRLGVLPDERKNGPARAQGGHELQLGRAEAISWREVAVAWTEDEEERLATGGPGNHPFYGRDSLAS